MTLVVCLVFSSPACGEADEPAEAASGATRMNATPPGRGQSEREMRSPGYGDARLDSLFEKAAQEFADKGLGADRPENPLLEEDSRWRSRLAQCADDDCRRVAMREVRRRLSFGLGKSRDAFAGIPWHVGSFDSPPGRVRRHLRILPLAGNRIVVRIDTVRSSPDRDCQLVAAGSVDGNGNGVMLLVRDLEHPLFDGEADRFMLRTRSATEISIEPMESTEESPVFCLTSHLGEYRASARLLGLRSLPEATRR